MADVLTLADDPTARGAEVLGHRRSPAHHLRAEMAAGSAAAVALREVAFLTQVALRTEPGTPGGDALEAALGAVLPRRVGEVTEGPGGLFVLWLAPDEFLAVAPDEADSGVLTTEYAARLAAALGDRRGQVVDLSANRTTLELSGPAARWVLDKACRLDLHPRVFPVGAALATQLGATPAILWRTAEQTWRVLVRSSFTTHVVRWLLDGMREYA
ncbi:sarcosine oxidase subunit gamma [Georgenia ruanii]|uniref:Sarcosine oxidase subunit gamma family protein n=1 Tax=Georgenia ruanii TaxID=348442 RepID=A0A7J9UZE0_9MICO|nr:sarcosine oxidase subunit gamma family protein [Georgenia ruanii]MPV89250.1 sarcosine oxidase subunit gamma family protein [Georgenia ruanii]